MKKKNNKFMLIALFTLLVVTIGATYAYFAAQKGTGGSAEIEVGAGTTDSLTFNNKEGDIIIVATQDNFGKSNESITETASVKAKLVPNNNTNSAHETYNIFLVVENNDLVYTKDDSSPELLLKITNPNSEEYTETVEGLKYYEDVTDKESTSYNGYDITTSSNQVYKIVSGYEIDANDADGTEQTWQVEATLINLDQDQNNNTGKTFEGSIYITTEDDFKLSEINTLKTNATASSIEAVADITNGTSKIANYYFAIEKTSESPETIKLSSIANALGKEYIEETSNSHTFNENIEANQNYKIYTYTTDEQGYKSNIYETVVAAREGELPEVGEIETSSTVYSITLKFPSTERIEYRVRFGNDDWTSFSTEKTKVIRNLKENTSYTISVQAKDENGLISNIKAIKASTIKMPAEPILSEFIISKAGTKVGAGETEVLLQHTPDLENGAGDNSYRYSGNNPYNFVCFGNGSEEYNNGGDTCPDTNSYRIIGLFDVDGEQRVKLIKSEYITSDELGIPSDETNVRFSWNETNDSTWSTSTLYQALNNSESGYLNFLGTTWTAKIATTTWHAGGSRATIYYPEMTSKEMYEEEITSMPTVFAQIGLVYVSDFGFANEQNAWSTEFNDIHNYCDDNWLDYYKIWTISPYGTGSAFLLNGKDLTHDSPYKDHSVQPSFYLNSDVQMKVDGSIGDAEHPFRIVV